LAKINNMEWIKRHKLIITVFVILIILFVIYSIYFSSDDDVSLNRVNGGGAVAEQELLSLLSSLRSIELDESLFSTSVFRSMVDFSQELTPEPIGRINPFLPFETSGSRNSR